MTTFAELGLIEPLLRALTVAQYEQPTPIQAKSIPHLLAGRDLLGCAQTGTGKTAAFALPVLQHLEQDPTPDGQHRIRALILSPTRELAAQIGDSFATYGRFMRLRSTVIFGGVPYPPQIKALRQGVDILVATPGRLIDLVNQHLVDLRAVSHFVLDEADRMLDMGFINDIRRIMRHLPEERQSLLFSATMPMAIEELAHSLLHTPMRVEAAPQSTPVDLIEQRVMFVHRSDKTRLLSHLLAQPEVDRALVFTRTKRGADRLTRQLSQAGINAAALHGNKSQGARNKALEAFKDGDVPVLVATDIASRGWDVDGITHVFNYDLSNEPEVYVHRIGRTGRAGRAGIAISLCDTTEGENLLAIEKLIGAKVPVIAEHAFHCEAAMPAAPRPRTAGHRPSGGGGARPTSRGFRPKPKRGW